MHEREIFWSRDVWNHLKGSSFYSWSIFFMDIAVIVSLSFFIFIIGWFVGDYIMRHSDDNKDREKSIN